MWRKSLLVALAVLLFVPCMSSAARALTISPTVIEWEVDPGQQVDGSVKLTNEGTSTETYYPVVEDFIAGEDGSTPAFVGKNEDHSLVDWVTFSQDAIQVEPGAEPVYVKYTIHIPSDAQPGGYYGGLLFSDAAPTGSGVGVAGSTGPLLLIRVSGDIIEEGDVTAFTSKDSFLTHLPASFTTEFRNDGTVHVKPQGFIRISNVFGQTSAMIPVNAEKGNVLPQSTRAFESSWQRREVSEDASEFLKEWKNPAFGPYTASLVLTYGEQERSATAIAHFWVIPWMLVLAAFGVILVGLFILLQYNKLIVARAMRRRS